MRVTMNTQISGTRDGADWPAKGEQIDLPDAEAADLLSAGLASAVKDAAETATAPKSETAKRPAAKRTAKG